MDLMTGPLGVLVVDDQAPFRAAVRAVLRRLEEFEVVGEASSGPEAVAMAETLGPALVLMDINMADMNGIEATRRIVAARPEVVVILFSTYDLDDVPDEAATSGARAYIHKERIGAETLRRLWRDRDSNPLFPGHPGWSE
jgi:two-component system, NarL family, invasion response regulator UvrY